MFEVPGSEIKSVHITEECVLGSNPPIYIHRSNSTSSTDPPETATTSSEEEENRKYRVKQ
jgi:ATP-dependent Clp protease ATP-binding subunit ClpX